MLRRVLQQASIPRRVSHAFFAPRLSYSSPFLLRKCSSSSSEIPRSSFVEHLDDTNQTTPQPAATISVDRSGLYNPPGTSSSSSRLILFALPFLYSHEKSCFGSGMAEHAHEPSSDSELVKHLKGIIKVTFFVLPLI